ncbi:MAG: hypothetical protein ACRD1Y_10200 [Terriglobales bacterium]
MKILFAVLLLAGLGWAQLPPPAAAPPSNNSKVLLAGALGAIGGALLATEGMSYTALPPTERRAHQYRAGITFGAIGSVLAASATARWLEPSIPEPHHFFWDKWNTPLFAGIAAVQVLDYTSTRYFRERNKDEWLLTNQLVDNRPAFVTTEISAATAAIGLSYLLHRSGHHGWERVVAGAYVAFGILSAIGNYRYPATGHDIF